LPTAANVAGMAGLGARRIRDLSRQGWKVLAENKVLSRIRTQLEEGLATDLCEAATAQGLHKATFRPTAIASGMPELVAFAKSLDRGVTDAQAKSVASVLATRLRGELATHVNMLFENQGYEVSLPFGVEVGSDERPGHRNPGALALAKGLVRWPPREAMASAPEFLSTRTLPRAAQLVAWVRDRTSAPRDPRGE